MTRVAALSPASLETERAAPHFDVEAMLVACVPGGSSCDPQRVADAIREYCALTHPQSAERSAELSEAEFEARLKEAKRLYSKWTDEQGIHCNRFPAWSELSLREHDKWLTKAAIAAAPQKGEAA